MHVAEVAAEKPEKRNLPAIEMGEINSGAEDRTIPVLRMLDFVAAQNDELGRTIQDCHIDGDLHGIESRVVLGIEETRVACRQVDGLSLTFEPRGDEIEHSLCSERCAVRAAIRPR